MPHLHHLHHRLAARLGGLANGGFKRRPQFFLIRGELQTGLHAGEMRIEHGGALLLHLLHALGAGLLICRVSGVGES